MITYTRAEIRKGTNPSVDSGQLFVRLEDAEYALDDALSAILCAAGQWEDAVREAMIDAGYFWVCTECSWFCTRHDSECENCGAAKAASRLIG